VTGLVEVGCYTRDLGASLERMIENALDWEHLPHTHQSSFSAIRLLEHGACGWRAEARLADGRPVTIDLRLIDGGWVTQTGAGHRILSEIRTHASSTGPDSCRVAVRFLVDSPPPGKRAAIRAAYQRLYADLYDEDERLMIARAAALRRGPDALKQRRPVTLPDGTAATAPVYCPHQGLTLDADPDADGLITCPWHGYRVDIRTGRCTPPAALLT
jgi:nitrite reductase/ring-hydroxylating ferredoxin subunit